MPIVKKPKAEPPTEEKTEIIRVGEVPDSVKEYLIRISGEEQDLKDLSPKELRRLEQGIRRHALGVQAGVIQICSDKCPSYRQCPLVIIGKAPTDEDCPIETNLFIIRTVEYREAVFQRLQGQEGMDSVEDIEKDRITSTLIAELVEVEILELRLNADIATEGLIEMVPALATEAGVEWRRDESAALKSKEKIKNRRDKMLKQLLATPEMIQKTRRVQVGSDPMARVNDTRSKVTEAIAKAGTIIIEAEIVEEEVKVSKKKATKKKPNGNSG